MDTIVGRAIRSIDRAELEALVRPYREVWIDIGTGNGLFVSDQARANPDVFVIGVDANRDNLRDHSEKLRRKPQRGGIRNALFVIASAERLPGELTDVASRIYINFPWGSLLRALVAPNVEVLKGIAALARPGARVTMLLNYSLFEDSALVQTLDLPRVSREYVIDVLAPQYAQAGFAIQNVVTLYAAETPYRTEWGQRLTVSGTRDSLLIEGEIRADPHRPPEES